MIQRIGFEGGYRKPPIQRRKHYSMNPKNIHPVKQHGKEPDAKSVKLLANVGIKFAVGLLATLATFQGIEMLSDVQSPKDMRSEWNTPQYVVENTEPVPLSSVENRDLSNNSISQEVPTVPSSQEIFRLSNNTIQAVNTRADGSYEQKVNDLTVHIDTLKTSFQLAEELAIPTAQAQEHYRSAIEKTNAFKSDGMSNNYDSALNQLFKVYDAITPKSETRFGGIWLDRGALVEMGSPEALRSVLQKFKESGINNIYIETINSGYPLYRSQYLPTNPLIAQQNWDPLEAAVKEAHALDMNVHAWMWVFAANNQRHNTIIGMPETYKGPLLESNLGLTPLLNRNNEALHQHEYWLDPANKRNRDVLIDIFKEVVTTYDVDGLMFDYIRYPFRDGKESDRSEGTISSFVSLAGQELKQVRPDLYLSAAVFPMPERDRESNICQRWEDWGHVLDTVHPMTYAKTTPELLEKLNNVETSSFARHMSPYPGLAVYEVDNSSEFLRQLNEIDQFGGFTAFASSQLLQNENYLRTLGIAVNKTSPPIDPLKQPVHGMYAHVNGLHEDFLRVYQAGKLTNILSSQEITDLNTSFGQVKNDLSIMQNAKNQGSIVDAAMMQSLQVHLTELGKKMQHWQSKESQSLRKEYFREEMTKTVALYNNILTREFK